MLSKMTTQKKTSNCVLDTKRPSRAQMHQTACLLTCQLKLYEIVLVGNFSNEASLFNASKHAWDLGSSNPTPNSTAQNHLTRQASPGCQAGRDNTPESLAPAPPDGQAAFPRMNSTWTFITQNYVHLTSDMCHEAPVGRRRMQPRDVSAESLQ